MFELATKDDLDRALSELMRESRDKLIERVNHITSDLIKAGALHGNPPIEIFSWARPQLENMNNSLLGVVSPNGNPQDHQCRTNQLYALFQERVDIMLRNVEIGHQPGASFTRAEKGSKEEWITAGEAARLLERGVGSETIAQMSLCKLAHAGLVRSRAQRLTVAGKSRDNVQLPTFFWCWAEGHVPLNQNWRTGEFDTYIKADDLPRGFRQSGSEVHFEAFNVSFLRSDVEKLIPSDGSPSPAPMSEQGRSSAWRSAAGGLVG